jgi:CheY-like chemotaxis protein
MSTAPPLEVLLVDDDEGHSELVLRNLRRSGFANRVTRLTRGDQALDYLFRREAWKDRPLGVPHLLVLDLKMPGRVDGLEVLRQLKADVRTRRMPVVMLTTTTNPREVARCYELGCSAYLAKPVEPEPFVETVRRLGLFLGVLTAPQEGEAS